MAHRMGLAGLTMGTNASAVTTITYDGNTSTELYRSTGTTSTTSLALFDNFSPLNSSSTYFYIVKHLTAYTLNSGYKVTTTSGDPVYQWSQAITNSQIDKGNYKVFSPAPTFRNFARLYTYNGVETSYGSYVNYHKGNTQIYNTLSIGSRKYSLECWGACCWQAISNTLVGGTGGYAKGTCTLPQNINLIVVCGGIGVNGHTGTSPSPSGNRAEFYEDGGYNGGGYGQTGGGGATHIATEIINDGQLTNYSTSKNKVLIVAGGGGGYDSGDSGQPHAGCGGGSSGSDGYGTTAGTTTVTTRLGGTGGTPSAGGSGLVVNDSNRDQYNLNGETTNGSFGKGGDFPLLKYGNSWNYYQPSDTGGGGGGGWYGGGCSRNNTSACGGGGSGYVNADAIYPMSNSLLITARWQLNSSDTSGNSIPNPTAAAGVICGNMNHGYARITIMPYD